MKEILNLLRIKHYIKNILIFMPLFFSGELLDGNLWKKSIVGFTAFCFVTSVVYIVNDIKDLEKDKRHTVKRNRPIASGKITKGTAKIIALILLVTAYFLLSLEEKWIISDAHMYFLLYLFINILYSYKLKELPIVDVMVLSSGFLIRILYGAALCNILVSNWLYLTVLIFSLYMGFGKRKNEMIKTTAGETRSVLKYYTPNYLEKIMSVCLGVGIVFYSLWSANIGNENRVSEFMIWTVPIVLAILMRYEMLVDGAESFGDPVEVFYSDKPLMALTVFYGLFCTMVLYVC